MNCQNITLHCRSKLGHLFKRGIIIQVILLVLTSATRFHGIRFCQMLKTFKSERNVVL